MRRKIIPAALAALALLYFSYLWQHRGIPFKALRHAFPADDILLRRDISVKALSGAAQTGKAPLLNCNVVHIKFLDWPVFAEDEKVLPLQARDLTGPWGWCLVELREQRLHSGERKRASLAEPIVDGDGLKILRAGDMDLVLFVYESRDDYAEGLEYLLSAGKGKPLSGAAIPARRSPPRLSKASGAFFTAASVLLIFCCMVAAHAAARRAGVRCAGLFGIEFGIWLFTFLVITVFMALGAGHVLGFDGGLLRRETAAWVFAIIALAGLVVMRRAAGIFLASWASGITKLFHRRLRLGTWLAAGLLALLLGTGLSKVIRYTPHTYDVMAYHLTPVAEWRHQGLMPVTIPYDANPHFSNVNRAFLGASLMNLWAFWLCGNIVLIELPAVIFTVALAAAVVRFLRTLRVTPTLALFFAAVVLSTPAVMVHMDNCKNYTAYIYPWVSLILLLAGNLRGLRPTALAFGVFPFAVAWSCKIVSTFVLPLTFGIFIMFVLFSTRGARRKRSLAAAGLLLAASLLAAGAASWFWIFRNYANDGVYFYRLKGRERFAVTVGGRHGDIDHMPFKGRFEGLPFSKNVRIFAGNVSAYWSRIQDPPVRGDTYEVDGKYASNFGLVYFSAGQVFLLVYLALILPRKILKPRRRALAFVTVVAFVALALHWGVYYNPYSYRSHIFFPLLVLPVALYSARIVLGRKVAHVVYALLAVAVGFHWWTTLFDAARTTDLRRLQTENLPPVEREMSLYWHNMTPRDGMFAFGDDVTIACLTPTKMSTFFFPLYDTRLRRKIIWVPDETAANGERFERFLRTHAVDVVYCDNGEIPHPAGLVLIPDTRYFFWVMNRRGRDGRDDADDNRALLQRREVRARDL